MRRFLTASLLIPAVICLVLWGHPYLLAAVQIVFVEAGLWEFFRLCDAKGARPFRNCGYAFGGAMVILSAAQRSSPWMSEAVMLLLLTLFSCAIFSGRDLAGLLGEVSSTLLGVLYVAAPSSLLIWVIVQPGGRMLGLFGMALVWTGDTMAYLAGRAWGRHKMAPRISPGKTWEGSAAAFLASILFGLLYVHFFWKQTGYIEAAVLAAVINVAAQTGDLAESALKRSVGVKDSSQLVPGHGGVLDRIDGLLFASPILWYYWLWKLP